MDLADVALLTAAPGRLLLGTLPAYDPALAMKLSEGLRARGIDPKLVAAALTQSRLRAGVKDKFGPFGDGLLLTPKGAQQATRLVVAAHHAERFRAAGFDHVVDLTCGIGAECLALAGLGLAVTAIELDPVTAAVAAANLARFPAARVLQGNALEQDWDQLLAAGVQAALADPDRRTAGGSRLFDPASYRPPLDRLLELRHRLPLGVKVAPGLPAGAIPPDMAAEWTSVDGHVVEAALWSGPLRGPAARAALVIKAGRAHRLVADTAPGLPVGPLQEYLYEPDGAVIRAGLIQQAAAALGPGAGPTLISPRIAYITAGGGRVDVADGAPGAAAAGIDGPDGGNGAVGASAATAGIGGPDDAGNHTGPATPQLAPGEPFLTGFRVLDSFDFQLKRLKSYLRARGVGRLEILKRGTAVEPAALRPRLDLKGPEAGTIVLTRLGQQQSVIVVERLNSQQ
ncbi:MAG: hypothetical protein LBR19_06540 [Bifidobacteriaceae bacterium]|jgi:hypothetical protein|nr:hypothetical protein [Bifidobacteriaceae bacterium]